MLDAGADPNQMDFSADTALMAASLYGHTAVVNVLLAAGADVNKANNRGTTALMYASGRAFTVIVKALLDAGAVRRFTAVARAETKICLMMLTKQDFVRGVPAGARYASHILCLGDPAREAQARARSEGAGGE